MTKIANSYPLKLTFHIKSECHKVKIANSPNKDCRVGNTGSTKLGIINGFSITYISLETKKKQWISGDEMKVLCLLPS